MARTRKARRKRCLGNGVRRRRVSPTPEKRCKLKADVIGGLISRQRLELHHVAAAVEIRTVM